MELEASRSLVQTYSLTIGPVLSPGPRVSQVTEKCVLLSTVAGFVTGLCDDYCDDADVIRETHKPGLQSNRRNKRPTFQCEPKAKPAVALCPATMRYQAALT